MFKEKPEPHRRKEGLGERERRGGRKRTAVVVVVVNTYYDE